jgi:hypothetical protein
MTAKTWKTYFFGAPVSQRDRAAFMAAYDKRYPDAEARVQALDRINDRTIEKSVALLAFNAILCSIAAGMDAGHTYVLLAGAVCIFLCIFSSLLLFGTIKVHWVKDPELYRNTELDIARTYKLVFQRCVRLTVAMIMSALGALTISVAYGYTILERLLERGFPAM